MFKKVFRILPVSLLLSLPLWANGSYYSAQLCWLLTPDPAGFAGGINFYAFAAGNPISFVDPSGMGPQNVGFSWIQDNFAAIRALQDDARIHGSPAGTLTGGDALSGTLNMIPLVSSAKAFVELNTGRDLITGQRSDRSDFSLASQAVLGAIILPPARAAAASFPAKGATQLEFAFVADLGTPTKTLPIPNVGNGKLANIVNDL